MSFKSAAFLLSRVVSAMLMQCRNGRGSKLSHSTHRGYNAWRGNFHTLFPQRNIRHKERRVFCSDKKDIQNFVPVAVNNILCSFKWQLLLPGMKWLHAGEMSALMSCSRMKWTNLIKSCSTARKNGTVLILTRILFYTQRELLSFSGSRFKMTLSLIKDYRYYIHKSSDCFFHWRRF